MTEGDDLGTKGEVYAGTVRHRAYAGEYAVCALLCVVAIGIPMLIWRWLSTRSEFWRITSDRIEHTLGVLTQRTDSLELWRVRDITYVRTLSDRLLGDARIILHTNDLSDPVLVLRGIPNHQVVYERLRDAIEGSRKKHRILAMEEPG